MAAKKNAAKKAAKKVPAKKAAKKAAVEKPSVDTVLEGLIYRVIEKIPTGMREDLTQYQLGEIDAWLDVLLFINPPQGTVDRIAKQVAEDRKRAKKK